MKGEVATGAGRPVYQLFQIDDMFLDSRLIAEIYGKGHDVAKADTRHRPGVLVREADAVPPLNELYYRLNGERNGEYWSEDEDFWDIAFHMQELLK